MKVHELIKRLREAASVLRARGEMRHAAELFEEAAGELERLSRQEVGG